MHPSGKTRYLIIASVVKFTSTYLKRLSGLTGLWKLSWLFFFLIVIIVQTTFLSNWAVRGFPPPTMFSQEQWGISVWRQLAGVFLSSWTALMWALVYMVEIVHWILNNIGNGRVFIHLKPCRYRGCHGNCWDWLVSLKPAERSSPKIILFCNCYRLWWKELK